MQTVIITEKPSVAREYARILKVSGKSNQGYIQGYSSVLNKNLCVTWAVGHLITLGRVEEQIECKSLPANVKDPWSFSKLPILPKNWFYKVIPEVSDQFKVIKFLYTSPETNEIYYAGDSGREGIYIQALIRNKIFNNKDPKNIIEKVVWIDSQTEEEILRGINEAKPYHDYDNMIAAGYERASWDWLMGMNLTEGFTLKYSKGGVLNQGRVMTPCNSLVVKRQKEIDNFVPTDFYGIKANLLNGHTPVWKVDDDSFLKDSPVLYNETGFKLEENARKLIGSFNHSMVLTVESITTTQKKEYAPQLFNLARLQSECSANYHLSPKQTLDIAQELYEGKHITYPRTDAPVLSQAVAQELRKKGFNIPDSKKYVDDSRITDHYAIIPTFEKEYADDSSLKYKIYTLILNRFKAITMPPYVYDETKVKYIHNNKEHFYEESKNGVSLGFKALYKEDLPQSTPITVNKGDVVTVNEYVLTQGQTKAPTPYTTGQLILAMEKAGKLIEDEELANQIKTCGIGTSATRADIIEKLATIGYITIDKNQKITPTSIGIYVDSIVSAIDPTFVSPEKTAELEQMLNNIAEGTLTREIAHQTIEDYIQSIINKLSEVKEQGEYTCPYCGGALVNGTYGYWCKTSKDFKSFGSHKLNENDVKLILSKGKTDLLNLKTKEGKSYQAYITKGEAGNVLIFPTQK